MARAKNVNSRQRRPAAVREELLPRRRHRRRVPRRRSDEQTRLLEGLAHRGQRQCTRPRRARVALHRHQQLLGSARCQIVLDRDLPVSRIDAPAREHVTAGHEHQVGPAPPEQHARLAAGAVDDDKGRGIARAQDLARGGRLGIGAHAAHERLAGMPRRSSCGRPDVKQRGGERCSECMPGRSFQRCLWRPRKRLCARLPLLAGPSPRLPGESISKRSAPAVGIASISRTRTWSPSR